MALHQMKDNYIAQKYIISNFGAGEMELKLFDGGDVDKYSGIEIVEISKVFAAQDAFCHPPIHVA